MEIAATQRSAPFQALPPRAELVPPVAEAAGAQPGQDSRSEGERRDRSGSGAPRPQLGDVVARSITLDPETNTFVFRALNSEGDVVLQFPDEVLLRDRAYARQMEADEVASTVVDRWA